MGLFNSIGGMLGLGSGAAGTDIAAPSGVTPDQLSTAYQGNQQSLAQQQALLDALKQQGGLGKQTDVYGQLQGVASGQGPNPAQAMLNQATGQNVANQSALMAGQRGAGANVGLMARQAAQQGAGLQQQAVGQGAILQANQSLNALGQMGGMANNMAGQQISGTGANTQAQQALQQQLLQQQANINAQNTSLANTRMQQQGGAIGGLYNALGPLGSMLGGGAGAGAAGAAAGGAGAAAGGAGLASAMSAGTGALGALGVDTSLGGLASAAPLLLLAGGGDINNNNTVPIPGVTALPNGPQSAFGKFLCGLTGKPANPVQKASGGQVDYRSGGKVDAKSPDQKAKASGNDYANDKIPAVLSEHEIVLPRTVTMSKDPVKDSAKFVAQIVAKRKLKR